ncbi:MAG TPA: cyclic-phosphate processing receiver domain-containing protein [Pyrinomonadaceae bacterium]|nr:cyclic-phosphate processing receiver domain-containing protein [Pyrinomonadaceae bacterium]
MDDHQAGRILIVEDDEARCAWFRQKFTGREQDVTCDVRQAVEWLAERDYALILLDHDLADEHYLSETLDDERTGYAVAAWLARHPDRQRDATILIHSLNYVGADRMLKALHDAGRDAEHVPFHYLQAALRM